MRTEAEIQSALWNQSDNSVHGKECCSCGLIKIDGEFRRDSSYADGRRNQCYACESSPRLSTNEHAYRLREANYSSEATRAQRWGKDQLDCIDEEARAGRYRHSSELLLFMNKHVPNLYFTDGNFIGDLSIFRTYGQPQPELEGRTFKYLFYMPLGWMREYSIYEFDNRDIPIREKERGWRTITSRFIKAKLVTEEVVNKYFGEPHGEGSTHYRRQLYRWRNQISD